MAQGALQPPPTAFVDILGRQAARIIGQGPTDIGRRLTALPAHLLIEYPAEGGCGPTGFVFSDEAAIQRRRLHWVLHMAAGLEVHPAHLPLDSRPLGIVAVPADSVWLELRFFPRTYSGWSRPRLTHAGGGRGVCTPGARCLDYIREACGGGTIRRFPSQRDC